MRKFVGFRLSSSEREMLDDIKHLSQGRMSKTDIVVMGINTLHSLAQEVRNLVDDHVERMVVFEHVRLTRDSMCGYDTKWHLEIFRDAWQSSRQEQYKEQIGKAAQFLGKRRRRP